MVVLAVLGASIQLALPTGFVTSLPTFFNKGIVDPAESRCIVFRSEGLGFFTTGTQGHGAASDQKNKRRFGHFLTPSACGF